MLNIFLSFMIYVESSFIFSLLFLYVSTGQCIISLLPVSRHFAHPSGGNNSTLSHAVLKSYVATLCIAVFFIFSGYISYDDLLLSLQILHCINIFWTLLPAKFTMARIQSENRKAAICGFGANISVNATTLSLMSPLFLFNFEANIKYNLIALALTLIAILKTHASCGFISFVISTWFYFFIYFDFSIHYLLTSVFLGYACLYLAYVIISAYRPTTSLFSISGRDKIFHFARKWIMPRINKWYGMGFGALAYVSPSTLTRLTQNKINQFKIGHYVWMHNDILQLYLEGGIIGLILFSSAYIYLLFVCITTKNYAGLTFLISYFLNSLMNFPNHLVPELMIIATFIKFILIGFGASYA